MSKITKVLARQVFDSRGNPTIEAEVYCKNLSASSICPSGASTGTYEAYEKRDKTNKRYLGKSVLKPVSYVNKVLSKRLFKERKNRPVISKIESLDKMTEFVSKHIFERMHFYNMAKYHINAEKKDLDLIINEIIEILNQ